MIELQSISFKNFLSTGNTTTKIQLDDANYTSVIGKNGDGKTLIVNAICFALYGKSLEGLKKNQLVNRINQSDTLVECEFQTRGKHYRVSRGIKPNIFSIYENGNLIPQNASVKDYQTILVDKILKISFTTFVQIVLLSSGGYSSFMRLPTSKRRHIIENVLDISIFTNMNKILHSWMVQKKEELLQSKAIYEGLKSEYVTKLELVEQANQSIDQKKEELLIKKEDNQNELAKLVASYVPVDSAIIQQFSNRISLLQKRDRKIHSFLARIDQNAARKTKKIKFLEENDVCPECDHPMDKKDGFIKDHQEKLKEFEIGATKCKKELDDILKSLDNLKKQKQKLDVAMNESNLLKQQIQHKKNEIDRLRKEIKEVKETDQLVSEDDLSQLNKEVKHSSNTVHLHDSKIRLYTILKKLLTDDGIKTHIIKTYLPLINQTVNVYLDKLNLHVGFKFDENFKESFTNFAMDEMSYSSFSEGQKARIDLAILFALREVAKTKNSTATNILLLDEIGSSALDAEGVELFKEILEEESEKTKIISISHQSEMNQASFDKIIQVTMKGNFSQYDVKKI